MILCRRICVWRNAVNKFGTHLANGVCLARAVGVYDMLCYLPAAATLVSGFYFSVYEGIIKTFLPHDYTNNGIFLVMKNFTFHKEHITT